MSGHVLMRRSDGVYEITCEDCDYRRTVRYRGNAADLMTEHALYHDRPRPRSFHYGRSNAEIAEMGS